VLFDKIAFVYLIRKIYYYYFSVGNGLASPGNRHCANCIGTLSFRAVVNSTQRASPVAPRSSGPSTTQSLSAAPAPPLLLLLLLGARARVWRRRAGNLWTADRQHVALTDDSRPWPLDAPFYLRLVVVVVAD